MKVQAYKENSEMKKGEVTAYLSLIFILLVTFIFSMLESASIQNAKNYRRADMNRAVECLFAEYQKELLEEYDIFSLEGSYETGDYNEKKLFDRLEYYEAGGMDQNIRRIQFLTDEGGQAFYAQAAAYMEHKYGIDRAKDYLGKTDVWRQQEEKIEEYRVTEQESEKELESLLEQNERTLPEENNPISHVNALKAAPLLTLVMPEGMRLSGKVISLSDTVSHRQLNKGYGNFPEMEGTSEALSALFFGEYVLEHFQTASDREGKGVLDYQAEYILEGKDSDKENLEAVAGKLLLIRLASNYFYLQSDSSRKAEAEALALTLCTLLAVPAVTEAAAQAILFAWAYGESVVDIRALLEGKRVPPVKTKESWQLQLSSLLKLGTAEDKNSGSDTEGGLSYKEYLRILLFLEKKEETGMRALDLIEQNLRTEHGQTYFRADFCINRVEFLSTCSLRRGVTYRFPICFGYN